ncbi:uncharacterized protein LOC115703670 [Cannabis sativa]|uniref:uncharacterized protein LOC115703670 n=1 Tax=Cannabis sativa TaxID=3483 RepID=UPI0029C9FFA2|nr:uncharacterized protein LOC115703670 [Cannabis sativa]
MENKLKYGSIDKFRNKLHFTHGLEVPRQGQGGGLMLLWKSHVNLSLNNFSSNHIDCFVESQDGDFNVISTEDKIGGPRRIIAQIDAFCPVVDGCHLCQIPYEGERITWTNKSQGNDNVKERLDYGFVDVHWESTFHAPSLKHLDFDKADHRAIKATITALVDQIETPKWHHATFGKLKKEIKDSHEHVAALQNSPRTDPDHFAALQNFELILDELLGKEKDYWHQRFRITWMLSSDSNTQFFHQLANARSATNRIKKLKDSNDNTQTSTHGLVDIISSHFKPFLAVKV